MNIRINTLKFSLFTFILLFSSNVFALPTWELIADKDGIKVYSKPDPVTGINSYKAEMSVETTTDRVIEVLSDIGSYSEWTPKLEGTKLLKRVSSSELYYYSVIKAPMVSNRDLVVHLKTTNFGNSTIIKMKGAPNFIPQKDGLVRMPEYSGTYKISSSNSQFVTISLEYRADPGGNLPKWMVNNHSDDVPMQMFLNLKKMF